tara:strand:+ start:1287 stop:1397 length:111 start_codon:yes stop_codon:yes gene_type:complete
MLDIIFDEDYYKIKKEYKTYFKKVNKDIDQFIKNIY